MEHALIRRVFRLIAGLGLCLSLSVASGCRHLSTTAPVPDPASSYSGGRPLPPLFDDIERRTFDYFWETTPADTGLAPDRHPARPFASVAAIGYALTAYPVGAERGWITRAQAA
ncbi:MAG: hypothetical protein ACTHOH_16980, partial [Lysobacteraceae bacterium]